MGSVSRGFRLAKASWGVVKEDRELLILPVISFFCSLVVMAVFGLGMWGIGLPAQGQSPRPGIYVLGFVMYVALAFVTIFFNAAVIGTAMKRLQGEDAKISDGLALARQHIGKIFVWALVTATVGMILRTIQERSGIVGRILLGIVGIAWTRAHVLRRAGAAVRAGRRGRVDQAVGARSSGSAGASSSSGRRRSGSRSSCCDPRRAGRRADHARPSRSWVSRCCSSRSGPSWRSRRRAPASSTRRSTATRRPARRRARSRWTT